jgi:hypothetical protein
MIASTLIAASVAAQSVPAPQPKAAPVHAPEKKMACCEKMAKGEGCACCKDMGKEGHEGQGMNQRGESAGEQAN